MHLFLLLCPSCIISFRYSIEVHVLFMMFPFFLTQILTTLRRNLDVPVTCKIRLLKSPQDTVELARRIERTGVSALAVHGRYVISVYLVLFKPNLVLCHPINPLNIRIAFFGDQLFHIVGVFLSVWGGGCSRFKWYTLEPRKEPFSLLGYIGNCCLFSMFLLPSWPLSPFTSRVFLLPSLPLSPFTSCVF